MNKINNRWCVYCTDYDWCTHEDHIKPTKCKRFQGNLDYTFKIRIIRFLFWLFTKKEVKKYMNEKTTKRSKFTYEIEFNMVYPENPEEDKNWLCAENLALALNEYTEYIHDFKVKQL